LHVTTGLRKAHGLCGPLGVEHPLTDDPFGPQGGHLVVGQAQVAQDLVIVLA
jgi:hypothetical protein